MHGRALMCGDRAILVVVVVPNAPRGLQVLPIVSSYWVGPNYRRVALYLLGATQRFFVVVKSMQKFAHGVAHAPNACQRRHIQR